MSSGLDMIFLKEKDGILIEINPGNSIQHSKETPARSASTSVHPLRPWLQQVNNTKPSVKTSGKIRQRKS